MSIIGNIGVVLAFTFIGPLPFIAVEPNISLATGCSALIGFSQAFVLVSSFARAQSAAVHNGFSKDTETYHLISGNIFKTTFLNLIFKFNGIIPHLILEKTLKKLHGLYLLGMWTSSLYLGNFFGPTLAGFAVEAWNFRTASVFYWSANLLVLVIKRIVDISYNLKYSVGISSEL